MKIQGKKFPGTPEHVANFMLFVAEEVRTIIAALGILDWTGGGLDTHLYEEVRLFDLSTKNETLIFKSFDCYMICYI